MKRQNLALIMGICLMLSMLSGCGGQGEQTKGDKVVLNIGFPDLGSMDVSLIQNTHTMKIQVALYEPLVRLSKEGEMVLENGLAKEITANEDKTEFIIKLHDNAKWENGDPLTAHDYVYSLKRTLDPKTAAPYAMQLFDFKNAMQVYTGQMKPEELGAKASDDYTLVLTFNAPVVDLAEMLLINPILPQNEKFIKATPAYASSPEKMLSCGPFRCTYYADEKVVLERNSNYYDAENVGPDQVVYHKTPNISTAVNLFSASELDFTYGSRLTIPEYNDKPEEVLCMSNNSTYVAMNHSNPFLQNVNLRKALICSVNVEKLITVYDKTAVKSTSVGAYTSKGPDGKSYGEYMEESALYPYEPEEAKRLLAIALQELGTTSEKLEKALVLSLDESETKLAEIITGQWKEILGLEISNQILPVNTKIENIVMKKHTLSLLRFEFPSDVSKNLVLSTSETTLPISGYSNAAFDALYQKIYMESTNQRYEYCKQAEQMLRDDGVILPLLSESVQILMNPEIKNVKINKTLFTFEIKWATK